MFYFIVPIESSGNCWVETYRRWTSG